MGKLLQPEPEVTVLKPQRTDRVPLVGDIGIRYPYSGDDVCKLCGKLLSRYNSHVICFGCIEKNRTRLSSLTGPEFRELLNRRRRRNPGCPRPGANLNFGLIEQCITTGMSRGRHHPQNGHS